MAQSIYFTHDFTDPVTTPCGHNFCKSCLAQYWDKCQLCCCPTCKEKFTKDLKSRSTPLYVRLLSTSRKKLLLTKALKSCLDCGMTFCTSHLEPHSHVKKLQKHKLINPLKNLADYICQKHQRPLEMFCKDDQMFVCEFCLEGDHRNHMISHIEDETGRRKTQLEKTKTEVRQMIRDRLEKIQEIKHRAELCREITVTQNAASIEVFSALIHSIQVSHSELLGLTEKKQKLEEKQAEELIKDLKQESLC